MWIVDGLLNAARMAWEVWWALILGFVLILLLWLALNALVSRRDEESVRVHALHAESGHVHHTAAGSKPFSLQGWSDVAHNFRGDLEMLWKELIGGFLIAGYISLLP